MILSRGKQPRAIDCFRHWNIAVVIVLLAINAAKLAIKKTGQKTPLGMDEKKICSDEFWFAIRKAPCPK
jgi:hypothetical protein